MAAILVVEDELLSMEMLVQALKSRGHEITGAVSSAEEALASIERRRPDLIVMDVKIKGDIDGITLAEIVNERFRVPVIYVTAFASGELVTRAKKTASYGYLIKPFSEHELLTAVEIALYKHGMDERLRESEERYRTLFMFIRQPILIHATSGMIIDCNQSFIELFRVSPSEATRMNIQDLFADGKEARRYLAELKRVQHVRDTEAVFRRSDGDEIICVVNANITDPGKRGSLAQMAMHDVTEMKRMERTLRESEERYRTLVENINDVIFSLDITGNITYISPAVEHLSGYHCEDLIGRNIREFIHPDDLPELISRFNRTISGEIGSFEFRVIDTDGSIRHVRTSSKAITRDGAIVGITGVVTDITERRKYQEKLKRLHAENVNLLNAITSILIGVSTTDVITHWNHVAESVFGIPAEEAVGKKITGFALDWDWAEIYAGISAAIMENRAVNISDVRFSDNKGRRGILGITITPIRDPSGRLEGFLIFGRDVTEKRLIEDQLRQSSKMATIGEIATDIAHELNQPLNVIKTAAQFLLDGVKEKYCTDEFIEERAVKIIAQTDRAARIITHLRDFGRKSGDEFKPINPNVPIIVALDLLKEQLILHSIQVENRLADNLPQVMGDAMRLEQVFINLIVNARDALDNLSEESRAKAVTVSSRHDPATESVVIEFADNGPGIPPEIIDRIFDPFFTTKDPGKGTGLGLSISYSIIKSHRGDIRVSSGSEGTIFTITLPVAKGDGATKS